MNFSSTLLLKPYLSYPRLFLLIRHSASLTLILFFVMLSLISYLPSSSLHLTLLLILYLPSKIFPRLSQFESCILPIFHRCILFFAAWKLSTSLFNVFCLLSPLPLWSYLDACHMSATKNLPSPLLIREWCSTYPTLGHNLIFVTC
jgi:hypothetical protein